MGPSNHGRGHYTTGKRLWPNEGFWLFQTGLSRKLERKLDTNGFPTTLQTLVESWLALDQENVQYTEVLIMRHRFNLQR